MGTALWTSCASTIICGCGLLPGFKELEPPKNPSVVSSGVNEASADRGGASEGSRSPNPTPAPMPSVTPLPGEVTPPVVGPSQPQVKCTFKMECLENGNAGVNMSGVCLNKAVHIAVARTSNVEGPAFPQCAQARPIFLEPLPTGKHTTTVEGGVTLKASCDETNFVLRSSGLRIQMTVPQAVCLELRDRINALKL